MNKALNQKISQFLDDDLDVDSALDLLKKIQSDADSAKTMNRYEAISHYFKTHEFLVVPPDFSTKIAEQIRQEEPIYLLPKPKPSIFSGYEFVALAASVAIVAVLAVRGSDNPTERLNRLPALQAAKPRSEQAPKPVLYAHQSTQQKEQYPLNKRINDYLQAHNNSIYTSGEAILAPLTSVTAYRQK